MNFLSYSISILNTNLKPIWFNITSYWEYTQRKIVRISANNWNYLKFDKNKLEQNVSVRSTHLHALRNFISVFALLKCVKRVVKNLISARKKRKPAERETIRYGIRLQTESNCNLISALLSAIVGNECFMTILYRKKHQTKYKRTVRVCMPLPLYDFSLIIGHERIATIGMEQSWAEQRNTHTYTYKCSQIGTQTLIVILESEKR